MHSKNSNKLHGIILIKSLRKIGIFDERKKIFCFDP